MLAVSEIQGSGALLISRLLGIFLVHLTHLKMLLGRVLFNVKLFTGITMVGKVFIHFPLYSSVPNRRACTFINFEEKIPPARPYLALHVYCF